LRLYTHRLSKCNERIHLNTLRNQASLLYCNKKTG